MDWFSLFPGASRDKPRLMALAGAVIVVGAILIYNVRMSRKQTG